MSVLVAQSEVIVSVFVLGTMVDDEGFDRQRHIQHKSRDMTSCKKLDQVPVN
jgi:hypothetical protein